MAYYDENDEYRVITGNEFGEDTDWDTEYNPDYGNDE